MNFIFIDFIYNIKFFANLSLYIIFAEKKIIDKTNIIKFDKNINDIISY